MDLPMDGGGRGVRRSVKSRLDRKNRKMWERAKRRRDKLRARLFGRRPPDLPGPAAVGIALAALAAAAAFLSGCQMTPSRTNTMRFDNCRIVVNAGSPEQHDAPACEILTQAMAIETSGSESLSPVATVSPQTDVSLSRGVPGGGLVGDLGRLIHGGGGPRAAPPAATCKDCPGGACADCPE